MDGAERSTQQRDQLALAAAVARRHLIGGESKSEIAADLGLSRFKVARLVDAAHQAGLVRIEVRDPTGPEDELAEQLRRQLGLRRAVVVPGTGTVVERRRALGEAAARLLCELLGPDDVLGLPWSRGVHDMVNALQDLGLRPPAVPVIQLSGALATGSDDSSTVDVVRRASRVLQAERKVFFAPLVMPDADAAAILRREPSVREALAAADRVTVAVVGIGAWTAGESTIFDEVDSGTRRQVSRTGTIGEVAGLTFDAAGQAVGTPLGDRLVTVSPEQLAAVREVMGIAQGPGKVAAIRAVATSGLVTSLVTTAPTAELLLR